MAIQFDNATHYAGTTSEFGTFSYIVGPLDKRYLLIGVDGDTVSDKVTGITYAGQALTQVGSSIQKPGNRFSNLYRLINPPNGTADIVVTNSASAYTEPVAMSFGGVAQLVPEAIYSGSSAGSFVLGTVTTLTDFAWVVGVGGGGGGGAVVAGANQTMLDGQSTYNWGGFKYTTNPVTSPSAVIVSGGTDTDSINNFAIHLVSLAPDSISGGLDLTSKIW